MLNYLPLQKRLCAAGLLVIGLSPTVSFSQDTANEQFVFSSKGDNCDPNAILRENIDSFNENITVFLSYLKNIESLSGNIILDCRVFVA